MEMLGLYVTAILYPGFMGCMSAQTREQSAKLIKEKHGEIIKFFPLIGSDIVKTNFSKDNAEVLFSNGSRIDNICANQSSKGLRRHRIMLEEAALLNDEIYQDVIEPIVNIGRRTMKSSILNPYELNGSTAFLTTAYYKGSEYERNLQMLDSMAELDGSIVIGSNWELAAKYGRGETRTQILSKKEKLSPIFFNTNYESIWVGSSDNCIIDINKLMDLRVLPRSELKGDGKSEYYIGVDVARSTKTSNNQTSISIGKVKRNKENRVKHIQLINIINLPNGMNFTGQAIIIKRLKELFKARRVIIDGNGLGVGLVDELLKSHIDPNTGEELMAYDTINTDHESDEMVTDKCVYVIFAQGINSEIIVNFMSVIEGKILQLLEKVDQNKATEIDNDIFKNGLMPSIQTDFFIEEVANLQLKTLNGGKLTVERNSRTLDKDRYSSVAYMCYYIMNYENKKEKQSKVDFSNLFKFSKQRLF